MPETKITKEQIIEALEKMTLLEINDLVSSLEEKFNISAATIMPAPTAQQNQPAENSLNGKEVSEEKTSFNVILESFGKNKIAVIKAVREINQNLGLKEAKDLVENAPKAVIESAKKEEAETAKKKLEDAGAKVALE